MADSKKLKIVIVGDGAVGKTCLCLVFAGKEVKWDSYEPTIFENHAVDFKVGDQDYSVTVWDTAGQEEFLNIRT